MGQARLTAALAAIAATLGLAAPAAAAPDDPVGPGQVIADPSTETEPAPEDVAVIEDTSGTVTQELVDDPAPKRGEIHVLRARAGATTPSAAPAAPAPRRASAKTLPFTGVNAGLLALCGLALVAAGSGLRRLRV